MTDARTTDPVTNDPMKTDQRAYLAASLLFMPSVKQNFGRLYTKATTPSALRNQRRRETQCGTYALPLVLDSETGR